MKIDRPSHRQALWQAYLSRAGTSAFAPLEEVSHGIGLSALRDRYGAVIDESALRRVEGPPVWQFIVSAPVK